MPARAVRTVAPEGDPTHHPYSLVRSPDGVIAWVAGVLPYGADGSVVQERPGAIDAALRVLGERVEAAGATLADVVQVTAYLIDLEWRDDLNAAWLSAFPEPMPARTAVEVRRLPRDAPIELAAVVHVGGP